MDQKKRLQDLGNCNIALKDLAIEKIAGHRHSNKCTTQAWEIPEVSYVLTQAWEIRKVSVFCTQAYEILYLPNRGFVRTTG